jgi:hypothetical protein
LYCVSVCGCPSFACFSAAIGGMPLALSYQMLTYTYKSIKHRHCSTIS